MAFHITSLRNLTRVEVYVEVYYEATVHKTSTSNNYDSINIIAHTSCSAERADTGARRGQGEKVKDKRNRHVAADICIPVVAACRFVDRS